MKLLWTKLSKIGWLAASAAACLTVYSICNSHQPPVDDCPKGGQSMSSSGKNNDKGRCSGTSTATNTATSTHTSTSTSTNTDTGGTYPFPANPGKVCTVDRFQQSNTDQVVKKVDVLFVMDHSGSMADDWARVANNVENLVKELPTDLNVRYAVLLANASGQKGKLYAASGTSVVLDNAKLSTKQIQAALQKTFAAGMKVSDPVGSGEAAFLSLNSAVTTNALANQKMGFFRADAALSILFMSDEQEIGFPFPNPQAPGLPPRCDAASEDKVKREQYDAKGINLDVTFNAVKKLKGDMPVMTHAFVNITKEDLFTHNSSKDKCLYDSLGYGYFEMVAKTKGVLFSIQADKAKGMAACGRAIKEGLKLVHEFPLSKPADKVDPATIIAAVDVVKVAHEYRVASNTVYLQNAGASGSKIEIQHCEPVARQEWTMQNFSGTAGQYAASLSWKTPEHATSGRIVWGLQSNALGNETVGDNSVTDHVVTVPGLNPNAIYYFQAVSKDEYGVEKRSDVISLRTKPDWSLNNLGGQPSRNSVNVSWKTPEYATVGKVRYGVNGASLDKESASTAAANDHSVLIDGLNANTTYYFQAVSKDEYGLEKQSSVVPVKTLTDWAIVGFQGTAARNSASLQWQTPEYATQAKVVYGLSATALTGIAAATAGNDHAVTVNGLQANTLYYFQAVGLDDLGIEKRSAVISLRTINDWNISGFSGDSTQTSVSVNWNTTGYNTTGQVRWGSSADALNSSVAAGGIAQTHSAMVQDLAPDTLYYFQAVSSDDLGLTRVSEVVAIRTQVKPADPVPLPTWEITDFTGAADKTLVNLSWKTSGYATSGKVLWGTSDSSLGNEVAEPAATKDHAVAVTGLTSDTLYYFQAVSNDDRGQEKRSAVIAVHTAAEAPSDPPPVSDWIIQGFDATTTANSADVIWQTPGAVTKATLQVGLSADDLTFKSVAVDTYAEAQVVNVPGLSANTSYYFKVIAVDKNGHTVESTVLFKRTKAAQ